MKLIHLIPLLGVVWCVVFKLGSRLGGIVGTSRENIIDYIRPRIWGISLEENMKYQHLTQQIFLKQFFCKSEEGLNTFKY